MQIMETRTSTEQTRRCFLGSAGAVALGVAAAGLSARATDARAEESGSDDGATWDKQADVLVIGAGFGGLTCTCAALDQGASVIMIDVSTRAGSTALMCSGLMTTHGSNSVEELSANAPLTDAKLGQAFLDAWPQLLGWLESIGAPLAEEQRETETGSYPIYRFGAELAPAGNIIFANFLESYAKDNGADIMYQTKAKKLLTDETGRVTGVKAIASDGSTLLIGAKNVILACGGTQNNKAMAAEYISPYADLMVSRGNPHDDGCGLAMAQEVGGVPSRGFGTFYGHPVPYGLEITEDRADWDANIVDDEWVGSVNAIFTVAQNSGVQYGIAVNLEGKRFFDESKDDLLLNQAIARQTFARAYEVLDANIRSEYTGMTAVDGGIDQLGVLEKWGGTLYQADTIEELADMLAAEGVVKANFLRSVQEYNDAVDAGTTADLEVPKANPTRAVKIEKAPFYAFAVVPGYSFSFGGVKVDTTGRVVDVSNDPIAGLWAVPGTAGGMQYDTYIGVLSTITAMSYVAGTEAAKEALA